MQINELLLYFLATVVFSFLIGLEVRAYLSKFHENDSKIFLGTIRTYTFLGIMDLFYINLNQIILLYT